MDSMKVFQSLCGLRPNGDRYLPRAVMLDFDRLYARMQSRISGQESATRQMAAFLVAEYMRCRQVSFLLKKPSSLPPRRAMLLVGPSGSGKTHLAKTAAWAARIPFYVMDAEIMNRDGYSGATFYSEIEHAQKLFGSNVLDADKPFMVLVENIDIAARSANSTSNDPLCDFVDLLKGCYRYTRNDDFILVFSGRFDGAKHASATGGYVFGESAIDASFVSGRDAEKTPENITIDDLVSWGLRSDFAKRITHMVQMEPLNKTMLEGIISGIDNSIEQRYKGFFDEYDVAFALEGEATRLIAAQAAKSGDGVLNAESAVRKAVEDAWGKESFKMPVGAITVGVRDGEITAIFESPGEGISFDEIACEYGEGAPAYVLQRVLSEERECCNRLCDGRFDKALRKQFASMPAAVSPFVRDGRGTECGTHLIVAADDEGWGSAELEIAQLAFRAAYQACCFRANNGELRNLELLWGFMKILLPHTDFGVLYRACEGFQETAERDPDNEAWVDALATLDEMCDCYSEDQLVRGVHLAMLKLIECIFDEDASMRFRYPQRYLKLARKEG